MKKKLIIAVIGFIVTVNSHAQNTSLFNGKNLDGWKVYGTEKWYVENGDLVCESGKDKAYGYLGTKKHYKDFILTLEFKQWSNGNSGVFIRSTLNGTKIKGWQVEVAPKGKHTGGVYESYGRGWLIKPEAEKENVLKEGEWNTMKIIVKGSKLTSWLNGTKMISLDDEKIGKGEGGIALQIHSGGNVKLSWKNIKIKEL
ncbi:3-keto-disaccharide hydrolase [Flavivirga spongiicola]|uniref:DUF1080 domain-containing protein n=1 Tax=Flavivirga spongiicola TaxID=421621 RepID=A0ABU7XWD9_9FLAO|nr:DUF1080 domain-containing protein [Flavivirga sp. MEBiC05379]MDO5979818.1 DUF1080 domain-containing protein [Flavivirga sp. MEBiC05379]